jgi:hypothetical protein
MGIKTSSVAAYLARGVVKPMEICRICRPLEEAVSPLRVEDAGELEFLYYNVVY